MNKKAEALKMIIKQEMTQQKGSELIAPKGTIGNWVARSKIDLTKIAPDFHEHGLWLVKQSLGYNRNDPISHAS